EIVDVLEEAVDLVDLGAVPWPRDQFLDVGIVGEQFRQLLVAGEVAAQRRHREAERVGAARRRLVELERGRIAVAEAGDQQAQQAGGCGKDDRMAAPEAVHARVASPIAAMSRRHAYSAERA